MRMLLHRLIVPIGLTVCLYGAAPVAVADQSPPQYTPIFLEDEIIFATTVATAAPYSADPTGRRDSTEAINKALDRVRQLGGGTCYVPAGVYRVEGHINVPATVTLMGDWSKPEPGKHLGGTILMAYAGRGQPDGKAFISVSGPKEGNMRRLAIWHAEQKPGNIAPYPYSIEGNVSHVREITLVNSYRGINMKDNSGSVVSDIYGTVLETGIEARNSVEFGRIYNVRFNPDYWTKMPFAIEGAMSASTAKLVQGFVSTNLVALRIGKSDGVGVYGIDAEPARAVIDASMSAEEGERMLTSRQQYGFGGLLWRAPGARLRTDWDSWYFGAHYADMDLLPALKEKAYEFSTQRHPARMDEQSIFVVTNPEFGAKRDGKSDDTAAIQKALLAASKNGGGTVYLPQGVYRLTKPLQVPEGVELRGPLSTGQVRVWYETCALLIDWMPDSNEPVDSAPAAITLAEGAGLRGLTVSHTINIWETDASGQIVITPMPFTIRSIGSDTYVQDVTLTNAYLGIDLASAKCDNFQIKDLWGTMLREGIRIGGGTTGGRIEIATIDFGPWHGWKRLPKEADSDVRSPYNRYIYDHLDTYIFEDCRDIETFSIAGFFPRRHLIFREGAGASASAADASAVSRRPENIQLWLSMFDVARDESILALAGNQIDLFGLFVTGGDSGVFNWLEFGPDYNGSLSVFAPVVQPIFFNRPLADAPEGFHLDMGTSLTTGRPATASSEPEAARLASHAVDGNAQTYWQSTDQGGATLTVDLGEVMPLDRWRIIGHGIFGAAWLNIWGATLLLSEDGNTFVEADRFSQNIVPIIERPLPADSRARFVRLRVDHGTSPHGFQRARIHQFDVYPRYD